ncbi:MAG: PVC-type heme-binding CxxCH protein [Planctomycetaceae bacterium]
MSLGTFPRRNTDCMVLVGLATVLLGLVARADAQGYALEDAVRHMTVAEGLVVEAVAGEPMVRQPVAMEFDDRGRLWVIQYLQYPNPAGLRRVRVDRYSRTQYDRLPLPPPRGPRGADRITILEDRDGDGRMDQHRDFVSGLNLASGLAFGHEGVFVINVPYLLFYPDADRDDVPDADPQVLLTGFGMQDAHSVANSLTWGPDGWLYGCQGSTVTSNIRGIEFQQGVWRYHPTSKQFELFCEGGGNSWGLDFDRNGNLLYSTNFGGFVMLHGVPGAYLWKSFGKHGALHNPYAFGYFDHVPHQGFHGGHVTVGGSFYQATAFPETYRQAYIGADLLGHAVHWHSVQPRGATFSSRHAGTLLKANDDWFAPSDLTVGPDGAVYVADWHDSRTAHPDPDAGWDRSNGRIYRIRGEQPRGKHHDLNQATTPQLIAWLTDDNAWYARRAQRILSERRDATARPELRRMALQTSDHRQALRGLWALHACGGFDQAIAERLLAHPAQHVRSWTVRLLADRRQVAPDRADDLRQRAASDASIRVRCELACAAKRLKPAVAIPILRELAKHTTDIQDPYLPLLSWWAIEQHAITGHKQLLDWLANAQAWQNPLLEKYILERLMRRYAAEGSVASLDACTRLLAAAPDAKTERRLLSAIDQGLAQIRPTTGSVPLGTLFQQFAVAKSKPRETSDQNSKPVVLLSTTSLGKLVAHRWKDNPAESLMLRLAMRLRVEGAQQQTIAVARDPGQKTATRRSCLQLLAQLGAADCVPAVVELVNPRQPTAVQLAAATALESFNVPSIPETLIRVYPGLSAEIQARVRNVLFGRKVWALRFLQEIDSGRFSAKPVGLDELRRIALHADKRLDGLVRAHWGEIRAGTPEEKLAEMRRLNNELNAEPGDAVRGRIAFEKHCGTCHQLLGRGTPVGPDLTYANRKDRAFLLASLVDPSAQIRKQYMSYVIQTDNGRVLTGLIVEQTPASITLLDAKNKRTTVDRERIEVIKESNASLMPDGLYKNLKPRELRDVFHYLKTAPVPKRTSQTTQRPLGTP